MSPEVKKLALVSATSTLVTGTRKKTVETAETVETTEVGKDGDKSKGECPNLARVSYIRYPITFRKKSMPMSTFLDSGSEVNAIYPTFAQELGLPITTTDVKAQKIDGTILDTFGMTVVVFSVTDKANQVRFFEETFLMAVLGISFLTLSGANADCLGRELRWRTYTTKKALPTTRRVKLVGKKEFVAAALDPESEIFVVHVASLSSNASPGSSLLELDVYLSDKPQVSGLIAEEAPTKIPAEYSDFADVFSPDLVSELPKHTGINNHAIEQVDG